MIMISRGFSCSYILRSYFRCTRCHMDQLPHLSHHNHCDHIIVIIIIVIINITVILIVVIMSSITDQVGPCIAALLARPVYARVISNVAPGVENVAPGDVGKEGKKKEE